MNQTQAMVEKFEPVHRKRTEIDKNEDFTVTLPPPYITTNLKRNVISIFLEGVFSITYLIFLNQKCKKVL